MCVFLVRVPAPDGHSHGNAHPWPCALVTGHHSSPFLCLPRPRARPLRTRAGGFFERVGRAGATEREGLGCGESGAEERTFGSGVTL